MSNQVIEDCPQCSKKLIGVIEVSSAIVGGIKLVVMKETPDRNWILCDSCNQTICKSCCVVPDSGYCDKCFSKLKIAFQPALKPT